MDITTGGSKISKIRRVYKLTECAPMPQMSLLDSWKDAFSRVWEMKCAVPVPPVPTTPHGVSVIETATTSADVVCASASTSASAGSEDAAACTTATVSMNSADSDSADIMNTCGTTAEKDRDIVTSSTAVSCEYTDDRISETDMKLCLKKVSFFIHMHLTLNC